MLKASHAVRRAAIEETPSRSLLGLRDGDRRRRRRRACGAVRSCAARGSDALACAPPGGRGCARVSRRVRGGHRHCVCACDGRDGREQDSTTEPFSKRFLEPRIDDRGLPIADALVCGWMVPATLSIGAIALRLPLPMWLTPALGVPALKSLSYLPAIISHGAQLAICWTAGALACKVRARRLARPARA